MKIPTYPARPISGGPFPKAGDRFGRWASEPKYNGWRALVHIESGTMFNRQGQRLSINGEFKTALGLMRSMLNAQAFKWADVEALERRHNIGQGCLIVLDVVPEREHSKATYAERRAWLQPVLPVLDCFIPPWSFDKTGKDFPPLSIPPQVAPDQAWEDLQTANKHLNCPFYEGLVAKRLDSIYPVQLRNPQEEFPFWTKFRWKF